eukprot:835463_1
MGYHLIISALNLNRDNSLDIYWMNDKHRIIVFADKIKNTLHEAIKKSSKGKPTPSKAKASFKQHDAYQILQKFRLFTSEIIEKRIQEIKDPKLLAESDKNAAEVCDTLQGLKIENSEAKDSVILDKSKAASKPKTQRKGRKRNLSPSAKSHSQPSSILHPSLSPRTTTISDPLHLTNRKRKKKKKNKMNRNTNDDHKEAVIIIPSHTDRKAKLSPPRAEIDCSKFNDHSVEDQLHKSPISAGSLHSPLNKKQRIYSPKKPAGPKSPLFKAEDELIRPDYTCPNHRTKAKDQNWARARYIAAKQLWLCPPPCGHRLTHGFQIYFTGGHNEKDTDLENFVALCPHGAKGENIIGLMEKVRSHDAEVVSVTERYVPDWIKGFILWRDEYKCVVENCNEYQALQVDHVKSIKVGGSNQTANLQTLCGTHHAIKTHTETIINRNKRTLR